MTKKRGTPKRAKRPAPSRRRTPAPVPTQAIVVHQPPVPVVQGEPVPERILTTGTHLGELGLVEIKFSDKEEQILSEPVDERRVRIKPDGSVYLPHADYTRWFNRAFGRGGWHLVPVGMPGMISKTVVCPYVLYIHGKPAAFAQGEQEYFEGNKNQSYGDALESTVASALRRTSKRLGVALELWDREWGLEWRSRHAVAVKVTAMKQDGSKYPKTQWRRRDDPPLPFEQRGSVHEEPPIDYGDEPPVEEPRRSSAPAPAQPARRPATDTHHAHTGEPITQKQRQRFVYIVQNSGRDERTVLDWLKRVYKYDGSKDIRRSTYEEICKAVEAQGDLPEPRR